MARGHGGRRGGGHKEEESAERWLLTYADMITLLMALFMVLFSISSVNISKYQTLQQSLKAAFSGSILPGGRSIMQSGSQSTTAHTPATAKIPSLVPLKGTWLGAVSAIQMMFGPNTAKMFRDERGLPRHLSVE